MELSISFQTYLNSGKIIYYFYVFAAGVAIVEPAYNCLLQKLSINDILQRVSHR